MATSGGVLGISSATSAGARALTLVSVEPASGAVGEYAGLLAIRRYHESLGEGHRNLCIIPRSAHGTNPASAAMIGYEVKWIDDGEGMDLEELEAVCAANSENLAALMITYYYSRNYIRN